MANKANFTARLHALIAATTDDALAAELARTRSFLGALINLHWPGSLYEQVEPQLRFENMLAALKTLLLAESRRRPLLLLVEDAQWLDADSRTFLVQLTRNVENYPLAIILTARPMEDPHARPLAAQLIQNEIRLTALTADDITALVQQHLDGTAAPALAALLMARAEGNPFFAEQILLYLQEQGLLANTPTGWRLTDDVPTGGAVPDDVQTVLVARLDRLAQEVKQVVQTAAVLGREFSVQILSQMLRGDALLDEKVQSAQDAAVWSALSELRYLFRHALLRDAAYTMQLRTQLRRLHELAAQSFEQLYGDVGLVTYYPDLIYHYRAAELPEQECYYAGLAAEQSAAVYANDDAISYYKRTLELTPITDHARRYDMLLPLIQLHNLKGDRAGQEEALTLLVAAAEALDDNQKRAEALYASHNLPSWWRRMRMPAKRQSVHSTLHRGSRRLRPEQRPSWRPYCSIGVIIRPRADTVRKRLRWLGRPNCNGKRLLGCTNWASSSTIWGTIQPPSPIWKPRWQSSGNLMSRWKLDVS